jgi:hypothetical protein
MSGFWRIDLDSPLALLADCGSSASWRFRPAPVIEAGAKLLAQPVIADFQESPGGRRRCAVITIFGPTPPAAG